MSDKKKNLKSAVGSLISSGGSETPEKKKKPATVKKNGSTAKNQTATKPAKPDTATAAKNRKEKGYMMLRLSEDAHRIAKVKASIQGMKLIDYIEALIRADKTSIKDIDL